MRKWKSEIIIPVTSPRMVYQPCGYGSRYRWFVVDVAKRAQLTPQQADILLAAVFSRCPVTNDSLIDLLWGDDPDGGPLGVESAIKAQISHINRKLKPFGWRLKSQGHGKGYLPEPMQ